MKKIKIVALAFTLLGFANTIVAQNNTQTDLVNIGTQSWKSKNLDVATYSDGTPIPQVTDLAEWASMTTGAWCYYNNDPANGAIYGKLYNWYAVAGIYNEDSKTDASQRKKLTPTGYHIPSNEEWTTLITYLGGNNFAGGKMKETGTSHWLSPNTHATNFSGFTALPGGWHDNEGNIVFIKEYGFWWSSTEQELEVDNRFAYVYSLHCYGGSVGDNTVANKAFGFSVRCLKDITLSPAVLAQTFCNSATVASLVATGTDLKWYTTEIGGTALASTTPLTTGTYYVSQTLDGSESARVSVAVNTLVAPIAAAQTFYSLATVANLVAIGTNIKWYTTPTGGTPLAPTTVLVTGTYYASQTIASCESTRTTILPTVTVQGSTPTTQTFFGNATIADFVSTGTVVKWYASSSTGTVLSDATVLVSGTTYYKTETVNGIESPRTAVLVTIYATVPPTASAQIFCNGATVASLVATGTDLKWYTTATGGTPLPNTTPLTIGTYYVSQTLNGFESPRTAVPITQTPAMSAIVVANLLPIPAPTEVAIGTQTWKTTNLDVATYRDGTVLPQVTDPTAWANLTTGAWCYYNNDPANGAIYGKLYNWYAVAGIWNEASKTDVSKRKKLAPTGYHIPSDVELFMVTDLKDTSGFTGLPGGVRSMDSSFNDIGKFGYWLSSSEINTDYVWGRDLWYYNGYSSLSSPTKTTGFSVRCLRD